MAFKAEESWWYFGLRSGVVCESHLAHINTHSVSASCPCLMRRPATSLRTMRGKITIYVCVRISGYKFKILVSTTAVLSTVYVSEHLVLPTKKKIKMCRCSCLFSVACLCQGHSSLLNQFLPEANRECFTYSGSGDTTLRGDIYYSGFFFMFFYFFYLHSSAGWHIQGTTLGIGGHASL